MITLNHNILFQSQAAFFGFLSSQTLHVTSHMNGQPVTVLVDCGSTHNIIQPRLVSHLHLLTEPITLFSFMVGNSQHIHCDGYCPTVNIQLPKFTLPFFILIVEGADVILGIAWLSTLGRLSADFSIPELCFTKDGVPCTLRGESMVQQVSPSSLTTLIRHDSVASLHTMLIQPRQPTH